MAEPPVALVDGNADKKGTTKVAQAYLEYLYSADGQKIIAKNYYRPSNPELADPRGLEALSASSSCSPSTTRCSAAGPRSQPKHFADGGVFDQIYKR